MTGTLVLRDSVSPFLGLDSLDASTTLAWSRSTGAVYSPVAQRCDTSTYFASRLEEEVRDILHGLIREQYSNESDALERRLRAATRDDASVLARISRNRDCSMNVRALAARYFAARVGSGPGCAEGSSGVLQALASHTSPLIRMGVMLGFGDAGNFEQVRRFLKDPHATVAREAEDLLDDRAE